MFRLSRILSVIFFVAGACLAEDFMGLPIDDRAKKDERPLPSFLFGGGASLDYYLKTFDGSVGVNAEYRLRKNHSLGIFGTVPFAAEFLEAGIDWHWYFLGSLMRSGHDDFLKFAVSGFYLDHEDGSHFSPVVSFGYGRDILFFDKGSIAGRLEFFGSYVIGEPVEKENEHLPIVEPVRFFLYLKFSVLFF